MVNEVPPLPSSKFSSNIWTGGGLSLFFLPKLLITYDHVLVFCLVRLFSKSIFSCISYEESLVLASSVGVTKEWRMDWTDFNKISIFVYQENHVVFEENICRYFFIIWWSGQEHNNFNINKYDNDCLLWCHHYYRCFGISYIFG